MTAAVLFYITYQLASIRWEHPTSRRGALYVRVLRCTRSSHALSAAGNAEGASVHHGANASPGRGPWRTMNSRILTNISRSHSDLKEPSRSIETSHFVMCLCCWLLAPGCCSVMPVNTVPRDFYKQADTKQQQPHIKLCLW